MVSSRDERRSLIGDHGHPCYLDRSWEGLAEEWKVEVEEEDGMPSQLGIEHCRYSFW